MRRNKWAKTKTELDSTRLEDDQPIIGPETMPESDPIPGFNVLRLSCVKDNLVWLVNNAALNSKDLYYNIAGSQVSNARLWQIIWKLKVPNRVRIFIWKVGNHILPVRSFLKKRMVNLNPHCPCCDQENETSFHTLSECHLAPQV